MIKWLTIAKNGKNGLKWLKIDQTLKMGKNGYKWLNAVKMDKNG